MSASSFAMLPQRFDILGIKVRNHWNTHSDAVKSFELKMYKTSVNRSYYAIFHAARALLILRGIEPVHHDGVITMLSLHFVKSGVLPKESIKLFKNLLTLRTDVDYGDFESIEKEDADGAVKQAKRFVKTTDALRRKLIKELSSSAR
jgi:hypothetical protein